MSCKMVCSPKKIKKYNHQFNSTTTTPTPSPSPSPSRNHFNQTPSLNQTHHINTYLHSILTLTFHKSSSFTKSNQTKLITLLFFFLISSTFFYSNIINRSTLTHEEEEEQEDNGQSILQLDPFPNPRPKPILNSNRFLTYLPHSGFHNQRIALENALTLAYVLNRTLLIPPCFLGTPIPYISSEKLSHRLTSAQSKIGLKHCEDQRMSQSNLFLRECLGSHHQITTIGWDQIMNLKSISHLISIQDLPKGIYEPDLLIHALKLNSKEDLFNLKDSKVYDFKYLISNDDDDEHHEILNSNSSLGKFGKWINVKEELKWNLKVSKKRLICLGSLFGTSRIKIDHHQPDEGQQDLIKVRRLIRKSMLPEDSIHGILKKRSDQIIKRLGGFDQYWSVHIRLGDSIFRSESHSRAMKALEGLVTGPMNLSLSKLSEAIGNEKNRIRSDPPSSSSATRKFNCRNRLHPTDLGLEKFNQILYIATDSTIPTRESSLIPFFKAFPCVFVLNDFGLGDELKQLRNMKDGVYLGGFFAPLLDAIVSARSKGVVGTEGSTFSRFVVDLLFPSFHSLPIIERG
ncbi:hypothetical protein DFH28DRAFT_498411 [Melampsora americana]|nr:hypothetical protein DFH28DRAFT_498411 [Melampsora americana]